MKGAAVALGVSIAIAASSARASLTPSEQAQIRSFVASGQNAARVRALIARTDLSLEESAAALRDAVAPVVFDDAHAAFLRDLLFGGASAASRPVTIVAV